MKLLSLLTWVGQFGFSILFPLCFFLLLAVWLQNKFDLGMWIVFLCGILGFLTSLRTARICLRAMCRDAQQLWRPTDPPATFHNQK